MKVFIHKQTGEYGHYLGSGEFATASHPQVFPDTMNEEGFRKYVKSQEGAELSMDNFEIKNIEILVFDD
jgi:hypothetical protein